ncbi:thioredoxin-dependent thiol peroxidase [Bogoriella caseilytica]|uniref:thioredoxin-dependent peroxiredoxin n=1 Tax=Bogoriella caseilytica TaxID=56055 RepID=A0A3N2BEX7_9MICO|nr:thioredoxin-dependent thiol peroxidase [Bogoriella caseilytica]ROR73826.1 peroxiredoxin Q/BCP [Bogoriella caseilytica]
MTRLNPGDAAPDFSLSGAGGQQISLDALRAEAEQGVIVYFYPAASTPGCTTQACDFRDSLASLTAAGYAVVGISPDEVDKLETFADAESLPFPLASDPEHEVLEAYGAWGEKVNYGKTYVGVIRSTVVVGVDGTVTLAQYNVKATGHVARLRKALGLD